MSYSGFGQLTFKDYLYYFNCYYANSDSQIPCSMGDTYCCTIYHFFLHLQLFFPQLPLQLQKKNPWTPIMDIALHRWKYKALPTSFALSLQGHSALLIQVLTYDTYYPCPTYLLQSILLYPLDWEVAFLIVTCPGHTSLYCLLAVSWHHLHSSFGTIESKHPWHRALLPHPSSLSCDSWKHQAITCLPVWIQQQLFCDASNP